MYNPFSLEGKTILITGASSGIGRSTAIECSKLGAKMIITGRNQERLLETYHSLEGEGHQFHIADLTNMAELESLIEICPKLDGLVNNAGVSQPTPLAFVKEEEMINVLNINLLSPISLFQKLLKKKRLNKPSSIVFTSSISGNKTVSFGNSIYSTSKAGMNGFVKNAALEMAGKQIRVNAVCPGMIETDILTEGPIGEEELAIEKKKYPLKRFGKPEEVAYAIIYLLSDASSFVTGSELLIDGGFTLN